MSAVKSLMFISVVLAASVLLAADEPKKEQAAASQTTAAAGAVESSLQTEKLTDVDVIVSRANIAAYYQGANGRANVKMTITDKKGQSRQREFVVVRSDGKDGGDQKYFVYFEKPADVRKMVFMVHKNIDKDDDRWLYLPALDLVKRIAAGDKRTSFVGSDYLYEDVSGRNLNEDTHQLTETTDRFYVVKNIPKKPDTVEFAWYNVYIDRKTFIPEKIEYFNSKDKAFRTIEAEKIELIETEQDGKKIQYPTVIQSVVVDLNTGSKTQMQFTDIKYNIKIEDIFTERYLRRPPREITR